MSFPKLVPKRSPQKQIIIELGEKVRLRLDSSRSTQRFSKLQPVQVQIARSRIDLRGNLTERRQPKPLHASRQGSSRSSERNMHMLTQSRKPRLTTEADEGHRSRTIGKGGVIYTEADHLQSFRVDEDSPGRVTMPKLQFSSRNVQITVKPTTRTTIGLLTEMISDLLQSKREKTASAAKLRTVKRLANQTRRKINQKQLDYSNLRSIEDLWDYYEGQAIGEMRDGYGTLSFTTGERLNGRFVQNLPDGNCTFYRQDGSTVIGVWQTGRLSNRLA